VYTVLYLRSTACSNQPTRCHLLIVIEHLIVCTGNSQVTPSQTYVGISKQMVTVTIPAVVTLMFQLVIIVEVIQEIAALGFFQ